MMREAALIFGMPVLLIVLLIGLTVWASQDFANRCERAGGVNIAYKVCIPKGTQVLMTSGVAGDES